MSKQKQPAKKVYDQALYKARERARLKDEGFRQITVHLPGNLVSLLDRMVLERDEYSKRADVLTDLLKQINEPENLAG